MSDDSIGQVEDVPLGSKENPLGQSKLGEKWAVIGIYSNVILTVFKGIAGVTSGSSALIADAIHSGADILSSTIVFFTLKLSRKPENEEFPYGYGKIEALSTFILGIIMIAVSFQIIHTSIDKIISGVSRIPSNIALVAAISSIISKELLYRKTYKVGVEINSPSTIANAMNHRSDSYSSIAALIGLIFGKLGFPNFDPIAGIIVSLFILKMGIDILKDGYHQIVDKSIDSTQTEKIKSTISRIKGVEEVIELKLRQCGSYYFVDLDIKIDKNKNVEYAHKLCKSIEDKIHRIQRNIKDIKIDIHPM